MLYLRRKIKPFHTHQLLNCHIYYKKDHLSIGINFITTLIALPKKLVDCIIYDNHPLRNLFKHTTLEKLHHLTIYKSLKLFPSNIYCCTNLEKNQI